MCYRCVTDPHMSEGWINDMIKKKRYPWLNDFDQKYSMRESKGHDLLENLLRTYPEIKSQPGGPSGRCSDDDDDDDDDERYDGYDSEFDSEDGYDSDDPFPYGVDPYRRRSSFGGYGGGGYGYRRHAESLEQYQERMLRESQRNVSSSAKTAAEAALAEQAAEKQEAEEAVSEYEDEAQADAAWEYACWKQELEDEEAPPDDERAGGEFYDANDGE